MASGAAGPAGIAPSLEADRRLGATFEAMARMTGNTILVRSPLAATRCPVAFTLCLPSPEASTQVSRRQEGNPVLRYVRNVRWQARKAPLPRSPTHKPPAVC